MTTAGDRSAVSAAGPSARPEPQRPENWEAPHQTTLADRLRHLARLSGTIGLARAGGCSAETVRRYLRGARPSAIVLARICERLGVSADWLLAGLGAPSESQQRRSALRACSLPDLLRECLVRAERRARQIQGSIEDYPAFVGGNPNPSAPADSGLLTHTLRIEPAADIPTAQAHSNGTNGQVSLPAKKHVSSGA